MRSRNRSPKKNEAGLFDGKALKSQRPAALAHPRDLQPESTIRAALWTYQVHMHLAKISKASLEAYANDILTMANHLNDPPVNQVTRNQLISYLSGMITDKVMESTVYRRGNAMKHFFKWLCAEGIIDEDPAKTVPLKRPHPPLPDIITPAEADRLIEQAGDDAHDYCVLIVLMDAGPKREELLKLRIKDFGVSPDYRPMVRINTGHRKKEREICLRESFAEAFKKYSAGLADDDYFCQLDERRINEWLGEMRQKAGISKSVSCQLLRDYCGATRVRKGENIDEVLILLGYARTSLNDDVRDKYRALAARTLR